MTTAAVFPTEPLLRLADCVLRPYHASDLHAIVAAADDPAIARHMRDAFPSPYDAQAAAAWLRIAGAEGLDGVEGGEGGEGREDREGLEGGPASKAAPPTAFPPNLHLAVCLHDGTLVGGAGLRALSADGTDRYTRELGYWIARPHWGRGLATQVAAGLSRWALAPVAPAAPAVTTGTGPRLHRVEAGVFADNAASAAVLARAGFVREGVRRRAVYKHGRLVDVVVFGLVASDLDGQDDRDGDASTSHA